jgi:hypothetical protein
MEIKIENCIGTSSGHYWHLFKFMFFNKLKFFGYISESRSFVCSSRTTGIFQNEVSFDCSRSAGAT